MIQVCALVTARASTTALAAALLAVACGAPEVEDPPAATAPVTVRGAVLMEPPRLALGEVALIEVAVVTPPGHQVRPLAPPQALPGLWLLDVEVPPTTHETGRWLHRTRFRVRARQTGSFSWPAQRVQVERLDGEVVELALEAHPIEVESVARELPGRVEPFGLRGAVENEPGRGGFWGPALFGALSTLAVLGLVQLARRQRGGGGPAQAADSLRDDPGAEWRAAEASLVAAAARAAENPRAAADEVSAALRLFVTQRFGLRADALTTEELAATAPPFAMTTRWAAMLGLLARLDAVRFRADLPQQGSAPALTSAIGEARQILVVYAPAQGPERSAQRERPEQSAHREAPESEEIS